MDSKDSHSNDLADLPRIGGPPGSETEFYLADRWTTDSHGVTRCGDLVIYRDSDDPLAFVLEAWPGYSAGFSNGSQPAYRSADPFPLEYEDTGRALQGRIAHRFAEFGIEVPRDGLDEWAETAEGYAWAAIEEARAEAERAAVEEIAALPGQKASEILAKTPVEPEWIVPGVAAPGWAVMLAGREKLGKGSFMLYLLGRLEQGGQETVFGSLPEEPIRSVIYTEEPDESVREKLDAFGLKDAHVVYSWQLAHLNGWPEKAEALVRIAALTGAWIVFVDNISRAAGIVEESGNELSREGLEPLTSQAKPLNITVFVDHHHKKGRDSAENMSRGGTSLPGAVDVKLDMFRIGKRTDDRRRKLTAVGRIRATVWEETIELTEDGRDYRKIEPEPDREERAVAEAEAERITDLWKLNELGGEATVKKFVEALGLNPESEADQQTARRRLGMLVGHGYVDVEKSPGKANVWRVKTKEVDSDDH